MASASQQQCVHCSSIFSSIHELIHHQLQGCESPSLPHLTDILSNVPIPTAGVNPLPPLRPVSFASLSAPLEQSDFSRTRSFTPTSSVASGEHDRPFASPNCNLAFSNQESLDKHSKHCRKTFLCVICGKEFTISGNLTRHLRTHSKQKKFQCGDCDKKFNRSDDLRRHQLSHSGAKNYKCSICGRKFAQSAHLSSHRNTHSIVKPYNCDKCHKGFTQLSALRKHNTVFHPQDWRHVDLSIKYVILFMRYSSPSSERCITMGQWLRMRWGERNVVGTRIQEHIFECTNVSLSGGVFWKQRSNQVA